MSPQYRIKNWHEFQHFKDRNPLWIKLYRKILDQRDIMTLSAEYFRLLVCLWLLASEDKDKQGRLPSLEDMAWRLKMEPSSLCDAISHLDNFVISDGYQDDALETEKRQRREETEKSVRDGLGVFNPDNHTFSTFAGLSAAVRAAIHPKKITDAEIKLVFESWPDKGKLGFVAKMWCMEVSATPSDNPGAHLRNFVGKRYDDKTTEKMMAAQDRARRTA
jgi:hypothetical protein